MTKDHQRGEDRGSQGVAVQDAVSSKDKNDKASKSAKSSAEAATDVVAVKHDDTVGAAKAKLFSKWNPNAFNPKNWNVNLPQLNLHTDAWVKPVQTTWTDLVRKATAKPIRVDVISRADDILIRAEVPGIGKDRLDLAITPGTLTIRGQASSADSGDYIKRELPSGEFTRQVALPVAVQADKASATIKQGLLEIVLPKSVKDKDGAQKIAIQ